MLLQIPEEKIRAALASFAGVKRRFEYIVQNEKMVYIDDYAHHPEELRACINSVRQMYPGKKLTVIFQPHLFSRTKDFINLSLMASSMPSSARTCVPSSPCARPS
jgi:UDP-N-acetylmuramate--alanine ligase